MIDSLDNDMVIRLASYLSSQDLVSLALTCRRFGSRDTDDDSLMETTARQIICNAKQEERNNLPATQTYIELYSELEKYRGPRVFDQLIGEHISYVNNDKSLIEYGDYEYGEPGTSQTAICNRVMRSGKHCVTFTIMETPASSDISLRIGIVRPLPDWGEKGLDLFDPLSCTQHYKEMLGERTDRWGDSNVHHFSLASHGGYGWSDWKNCNNSGNWDGREEASFGKGDEVGMLLDLDAGTLSNKNGQRVYKNGRSVLSGEYCWTVTLWKTGESVRIEKGPIPTLRVGGSLGFILNSSIVTIPGDEQGRTFGDVAKGVEAENDGEQLDGIVVFDGDLFGKYIGWEKKNIDSNLGRLKKKGSDEKSRRIDNGRPGEYPQFWYVDGLRPGLDDYKVFTLS